MSSFINSTNIINNNNSNTNNNTNTTNSNNNNNEENEKEQLNLLSFAVDVMSIILAQFLTIKDIGKLDTAYCNKKKRDQLLLTLSNNESIVFDDIRFNKPFGSINDFMIWVSKRKINILELSIENKHFQYNHYLTDDGLLGLSKHCNRLKSLNVSWCNKITDNSMIEIARNCNNLKSLNISQ